MRIYRAVNVYVAAWEWRDSLKERWRFCSRRGAGARLSVVAKCNAAPTEPVWVTKLNREVGLRSRLRGAHPDRKRLGAVAVRKRLKTFTKVRFWSSPSKSKTGTKSALLLS